MVSQIKNGLRRLFRIEKEIKRKKASKFRIRKWLRLMYK
jgi:hypothetical protein